MRSANFRSKAEIPEDKKMWQVKSVAPWAHKFATRSLLLIGTTTLFASLALVPAANAQIVINVETPPVCSYGYYEYAPYGCAPMGFYGPGYFYNGIFLGVGPWASWGYSHGWGGHRFNGGGGGRYVAGRRDGGGRGSSAMHGNNGGFRGNASVRGSHPAAASSGASHGGGSSHGSSHAPAARGGGSHGGGSRGGGGESHGGGEHR